MDLDLTENSGRGFVWVVLHGPRDAARLRSAGFAYTTAAAAARPIARAAALPSGRSGTYRRLADYGNEMKALAAANPDFVRVFTLGHTSREGRPVEGLEITTNPGARDGSRSTSSSGCTTPMNGPPPSTRWSGRTSWSVATAPGMRALARSSAVSGRSSCRS